MKKSYIGLGRTTETERQGGSAPKKPGHNNKESVLSYSGLKDPAEYGIFSTEKVRSRHNVLSADSGDNKTCFGANPKPDITKTQLRIPANQKSSTTKKTRTVSDDLSLMNKKHILQTLVKTNRTASGKVKKKPVFKDGLQNQGDCEQLKFKKDTAIPKNLNLALLLRKITEKELKPAKVFAWLEEEPYLKFLAVGASLFDLMLEFDSVASVSCSKITDYFGLASDKQLTDALVADQQTNLENLRAEVELALKLERFCVGTAHLFTVTKNPSTLRFKQHIGSCLSKANGSFVLLTSVVKCRTKTKRATESKSQITDVIRSELKLSRFVDLAKLAENNLEISRALILM